MIDSQSKHLRVTGDGHVAIVTIDRQDRLNAYSPSMADALRETIETLAESTDARAILLTGAGETAFCAGMDIQTYFTMSDEDGVGSVETLLESTHNTHRIVKALRQASLPVVAAVNGYALGGGMDISLACDFRVVRADAEFGQAYVDVGLVPDAGAYLLPRLIGEARAKELIYTGERITGSEAADLGLAREAVDGDADATREAALSFARDLANGPTVTLGAAKELVNESFEVSIETALAHAIDGERTCHETQDHHEAIQAFVEDREPEFKGK